MTADRAKRSTLLTARVLHIGFLGGVLICVMLLIMFQYIGFAPILSGDRPALTIVSAVLGGFAFLCLVAGIYLPRWMLNRRERSAKSPHTVLFVHIARTALLESIAIYGLLLGVLGAGWPVVLPFLVAAAAALILTFPTEKRSKKMLE